MTVTAPVTSDLAGRLVGADVRAWMAYPPALQRPGHTRGPLRHPLHSHRAATPQTAAYVLAHAMDRPDLLPRRLPEGRGKAFAHVGVRVDAPAGAYSRIPVWRSRDHWVTVTVAVAIALHRDVLARHGVAPDSLRRWARAKSGYAWDNGRRCVVRPDTLASVLGLHERQVQRLNACARELHLEVVVMTGRMLTQLERWQAYDRGSRQRGLATETALTIPPDQRGLVDHVTPPRGGYVTRKSSGESVVLHGLPAGTSEAATRPRPEKGSRRGSPAWRLACDVTRHVPWLAREAPQRLVAALTRYVTCPEPWTGRDVAAAITTRDRRLMQPAITTDRITTRPAAVLAAILRDLDPILDHPALTEGPLVPLAAVACGHPSCDGHGWLRGLVEVEGYDVALKCPRCPASIRRN